MREKDIQIRGLVTVKQGDRIIRKDVPNHWVDQGLRAIISQIIARRWYSTTYPTSYYLWANSWHIYLGSDTTTPTATTMTGLVSPIGTAPGTPANSESGSTHDGSTDGIWSVTFLATWNAGTVSGTLGELALYERAPNYATFGWEINWGGGVTESEVMVSRLSSADADFSSFIIDDTVPLTVEWTVQFSFV